jgi:hypothetical protein
MKIWIIGIWKCLIIRKQFNKYRIIVYQIKMVEHWINILKNINKLIKLTYRYIINKVILYFVKDSHKLFNHKLCVYNVNLKKKKWGIRMI